MVPFGVPVMSKNPNGDQNVISCASLKTSISRLYPRGLMSDTTREGGVPASMVFDGGLGVCVQIR